MRQFECVADKKIYTESQLRQLFQFKVVHGYDNKFENWINEEIQNGYLRLLTDMEIPKYIVDKIRKQNEYCIKAKDLEDEIDNWCDKSGINIYSKEYDRNVRGSIADAVSPMNGEYLQKIADEI